MVFLAFVQDKELALTTFCIYYFQVLGKGWRNQLDPGVRDGKLDGKKVDGMYVSTSIVRTQFSWKQTRIFQNDQNATTAISEKLGSLFFQEIGKKNAEVNSKSLESRLHYDATASTTW